MGTFFAYSTPGITSGKKVCRDFKMVAILKMFRYQTQFQFDFRYEKIVPNYVSKSIFHGDNVADDVTRWPQSRPSIFLYKGNENIRHYNYENEQRCRRYICWTYVLWDCDYTYTNWYLSGSNQNKPKLSIAISPVVFQLEHRSNSQNIGNGHGYLASIFNFRCHFRHCQPF